MRNIYLIIDLLINIIYIYYLLKIIIVKFPFSGDFLIKKIDKNNFLKVFLLLVLNLVINIFCHYLFVKNLMYSLPLYFLQISIIQVIYKSTL